MSPDYSYSYDKKGRSASWGIHTLSVGYILLLFVAVLTLEQCEVIPFVFKDSPMLYFHVVFHLYVMVNIASYFYAVVVTDTSCRKSEGTPSPRHDFKAGYFFCQSCQQNSPPRAHHCPICDRCIDRRDHHCYFIGNCIGRFNLRYFIILNVWAGVVTVYGLIINLMYLHKHIVPLSPISIEGLLQLIPVVTFYKWIIGKVALFYLIVVIVTWMTLVQVLVSFICGCFQLRLLFTEQTTYEYSHQIKDYDQGWRYNYRDLCGKYWFVLWLFPVWVMKCGKDTEANDKQWSRDEDKPRKVI